MTDIQGAPLAILLAIVIAVVIVIIMSRSGSSKPKAKPSPESVLGEAEILIAYGRLDRATALLEEGTQLFPESEEIKVKLRELNTP